MNTWIKISFSCLFYWALFYTQWAERNNSLIRQKKKSHKLRKVSQAGAGKYKPVQNTIHFSYFFCLIYLGESKVLQYFGNEKPYWTVLGAFVVVMSVMNRSGVWDAEFAWYSQKVTLFYGLVHGIKIHGFRLTWLWLIIMFGLLWFDFMSYQPL